MLDLYDRLLAVRNDPIVRLIGWELCEAFAIQGGQLSERCVETHRPGQGDGAVQAARADFLWRARVELKKHAAYKAILASNRSKRNDFG